MEAFHRIFHLASLLLVSVLSYQSASANIAADQPCTPVHTVSTFDLQRYASKPWYVHQQAPTMYLPIERNYCTRAEYTIRDTKTIPWGYEIHVNNYTEDADGNEYGGKLCATVVDNAKLGVAPCFLPKVLTGPYWILAYDEDRGYALVSGGQPMFRSKNGNGCTTGKGVNDSGLWIFLRSRERDDELIKEIRDMAQAMDIDVSVLNDVDQTGCDPKIYQKGEIDDESLILLRASSE